MVEIQNFTRSKINKRFIERVIAGTLHQMGISDTMSVSVVFAGRERMRKINKAYRGKTNVADVLSFGSEENFVSSPPDANFLGEIFICPAAIRHRLKKHTGQEYAKEIAHLLVHGTLHLLGWEHEEGGTSPLRTQSLASPRQVEAGEASRDAMHKKEEKIMRAIL